MPPKGAPIPTLGFQARRDFLAPYIDLTYLWRCLRPKMIAIEALRATLPSAPLPRVIPPLVPITELMVGPSGHRLLNMRALEKLLIQVNRSGVTVLKSRVPYRSLN
jgi:hypothetical protein